MSYLFTSTCTISAALRSFVDSYLSTRQSSSENQGGGIPTKYFTHIHPLNKADENDPHYIPAKEGVESDLGWTVDDLIRIRNTKINQNTPTNDLMTRSMGSFANSWARNYPGISFVTNTPNDKIVREVSTGIHEEGLVCLLDEAGEDGRDSDRI
ncbi:uncharacterized protein L199_006509 [Kwoniella botswanensis]|uniref:uncharacterized protein n=1 Tax=Kwoniella botswanensis TaxID=1268659 RepID=UPI00315CBC16